MELEAHTADVLRQLGESSDVDLVAVVTATSERVAALVPSCLGFSYSVAAEQLTFTVVATSADAAVMDSAQYLDDGPCLEAARDDAVVTVDDVLSERRWAQYAAVAGQRGVRSSLSLPLLDGGALVGTVNFYASRPGAFAGLEAQLAAIVGASAHTAITNADPTFRSLDDAARAPARLRDLAVVDRASGVLAGLRRIGIEEARALLHEAARRAGLDAADLARVVVQC